jgi:hypothetical protein
LNIRRRSARRERGGGNDEIARAGRWDFEFLEDDKIPYPTKNSHRLEVINGNDESVSWNLDY